MAVVHKAKEAIAVAVKEVMVLQVGVATEKAI